MANGSLNYEKLPGGGAVKTSELLPPVNTKGCAIGQFLDFYELEELLVLDVLFTCYVAV